MEALLSLAFDNVLSSSPDKIKKGLRQVDLLLAQICLPKQKTSAADKRRSVIESSPVKTSAADKRRSAIEPPTKPPPPKKPLSELKDDPAFREFFKLQDGFEWNVATRLVATLDKLLGRHDEANDLLIATALELIQGILLLHPPSRRLFSKEAHMNLLLDLLEPDNPPRIQTATLHTLVTALISTPQNTRLFESLDGLLTITSLLNSSSTPKAVKFKLLEFLYFYLMPETPSIAGSRGSALIQRSPSKLAGAFGNKSSREDLGVRENDNENTRSTFEKQQMLRKYLSTVDDLVKDLEENVPFGGLVS